MGSTSINRSKLSDLEFSGAGDPRIDDVLKVAQRELQDLLRQRAELMSRIGSMKQTILGIAKLCGNDVLTDDLTALLGRRKNRSRSSGLTNACRLVLMEAGRSLTAHEVCRQLEFRIAPVISRHKDRLASVTTVLNRLTKYGEARATSENGRRTWQWASETGLLVYGTSQHLISTNDASTGLPRERSWREAK